uniref:LEM domain-containing protein n=1 Tax=Panagrellus redivivus TaxID=6233 RepID=A0A7E4W024_PANRE
MSEEFIAGLSDKELREKLLAHGASVGPVTGTSRRVLERKLARLMGGNTTQTTPRKPRTKSPARPVVSKPSPPSVATAPRPVENNISRPVENSFSSSISQSRVSDAFSSSRGSLGSSAHASSRGSVGSSAPQSSLLGSIGSSSYDTRKSAYPSLDSTSADRFDSVVGGTVYGGSSRYTDSSPVRPRFEQASPPPSYKKKITTTPPLQRYSARQRETEKRPNVDFQDDDDQYEEDDHMEWSREQAEADCLRKELLEGLLSKYRNRMITERNKQRRQQRENIGLNVMFSFAVISSLLMALRCFFDFPGVPYCSDICSTLNWTWHVRPEDSPPAL